MGLRFDPMGGGQFKAALNSIIEAEKAPIKALEKRKETEQTKMKLFGEFKGKFTGLQGSLDAMIGFNKFKELKAELGDGAQLMNVTLDKEKANVGSWEVEVKELAERSSMISNGFSDANKSVLGLGYITMQMNNGETQDVYVTKEDSSLYGIASKINAMTESAVKATVLKDVTDSEKPYRLVITAKKDGAENEIKFPQMYFVDGEEEFTVDKDKGSRNALLSVDGFEVELGSNDVPDFLQGVGVQLKQAKPGQKFSFSVKADYAKVTDKIKKVIEGVNGMLDFINKQNQVNESTDTKSTFAGDTSLQNIEFRMRNLMHEGFGAHFENEDSFKIYHLSDVGIEFDKKGGISIKEEKFQKAMEADFEGIAEVVSGEKGFITQLKGVLDGFSDPSTGILNSRERGIQTRIKQIDDSIGSKQRNLEKKSEALTNQFARLQGSLSNMQKQSSYLSATLGGGGGNSVSQLLGG
ncbi:MAG: flagellar filament capping protein FliD [Bdellovibrionales bacterium]|nr:flagellar filament capping protein FliD [Oligoflexia bacterium]